MDKIWFKNYDPGVPQTIDPDQYASIPDMLIEAFKKYPNNPCFINFGEALTFKQVDEFSQAYAGFLQTKCGLVKGDRVAIMMPNTLQYPIALFGALRAGLVNVNISPLYSIQQVNMALKTTGAKCILVLANFAHTVEKALPGTEIKHVIVTETGDLFPFPKRLLFNFTIKYIKKMVPSWHIKKAISFRNTITLVYQRQFKPPVISGEDLAYLQFTEGRETGTPKCAMLTHRNFIANGLQCDAWFNPVNPLLKGIALAPLQFFKLILMSTHTLTFMRHGMANNLITNPRDLSSLIKEAKRYPFSAMTGVRSIFNDLLFHEDFQQINFSLLSLVFSGGMPIPQPVADHWQSITRSIILQAYVLTESAPIVMITPLSATHFTGTVGLPLPSTDVKICDENGQTVSLNTPGEIWIKGPQVMKGYWNNPEKTKEVLTNDGWFKTGDIGRMNEEGYIVLIDRKEDIIKTERGTVYPSEVENIIREMIGIKENAVVAALSKEKRPIIKAYIVKSGFLLPEEISAEAVLTHCKRYLADYQVPNEIEFCDDLPQSATGYILRYKLRKTLDEIYK